jgi:DNA-binding CsgD family transcriptional regulator/tetratricopeptide (TPR) repeat protein
VGILGVMAYQGVTGGFVGRTEELAWLRGLLAQAADGQPLVALVSGEAGVGKTRLTEQLAVTAAEQGVLVLRGGCVPLGEEGVPLAPVTEALHGLARAIDPGELEAVAGPARAELGRLVPNLAWGDGTAAGPAVGRPGQGRLFDLLLGVVERLAARGPLLWIMEDLHWADRSTRDLLAYLATYLRNGPVLVLLTFRSDELHRLHPLRGLLGELARNRRVQRLELRRFSRDELAEQLAGLVGVDPPAELVAEIYARSEGNPFFTEELVLAGDGASPAALPPSLQEVLLTRVVRLGDRTQQLLRVAAAAGASIDHPLLATVAGLGEAELLDGLREAVDQQVLLPEPGADGYRFRHALVAEAVYGELLPGERVRLHTELAEALAAGLEAGDAPVTRAARIAHHWSAAGDQPRALSASLEAAAAAEQVYAFAEAQLQLERVLALWNRVPDAEQRAGADLVGVLARCAEDAYTAGDNGRAVQLLRRALPLADEAREPQQAGLLHEQLARCLRAMGDPDALPEQQEAVRLVKPEPSVERARVLGSLAQYLGLVDRFAEARGPAEEAVAMAVQLGARAEEANARTALGTALANDGETDTGLAELEAAHHLAAQAGDVVVMLRAVVNRSDALVATGRLEEAATVALSGIGAASLRGLGHQPQTLLACNATEALFALGRWEEAERISREALELAPADPASVNLPMARAALDLGLGNLDAAEAQLRTAQRLIPSPITEAQRAGPLFTGLAELALYRGDLERARKQVTGAVPLVEANPRYAAPLYALGLRVEADRADLARARRPGAPVADDGTAAALLERLARTAASPDGAGFPDVAGWHATALAEWTRWEGRCDPAAWAAAAAAWERLGRPYRVAYARFRQAEALMAADGDRDAATEALRRAAAITARLGARPLDAEVKALARRARLRLDPDATAPATGPPTPAEELGLTPREAEVLALVAAGRSNGQIAQTLYISPKTASVHVSNILAKLGVHTRVEAAAVAHRLGLD